MNKVFCVAFVFLACYSPQEKVEILSVRAMRDGDLSALLEQVPPDVSLYVSFASAHARGAMLTLHSMGGDEVECARFDEDTSWLIVPSKELSIGQYYEVRYFGETIASFCVGEPIKVKHTFPSIKASSWARTHRYWAGVLSSVPTEVSLFVDGVRAERDQQACRQIGNHSNKCVGYRMSFANMEGKERVEVLFEGKNEAMSFQERAHISLRKAYPPSETSMPCYEGETAFARGCLTRWSDAAELRLLAEEGQRVVAGADENRLEYRFLLPGENRFLIPLHETSAGLRLVRFSPDDVSVLYYLPLEQRAMQAEVTIRRVIGNPKGSDTGRELIELYNWGNRPVDLSGFRVRDSSSEIVIPNGVQLEHGDSCALVSLSFDDTENQEVTRYLFSKPFLSGGVRNGGEELILLNKTNQRLAGVPPIPLADGECILRRGHMRAARREDFFVTRGVECRGR